MGSPAWRMAEVVGFGHDVATDHAAGLADIKLIGPAAVVGELVRREAVTVHAVAHGKRHAGIGGQEIEVALLVVAMIRDDLLWRNRRRDSFC